MKKLRNRDVTFIETLQVDDVTVNVYVNNIPRSEDEIKRSMERLIKSRYGLKGKNNVRFRNKN